MKTTPVVRTHSIIKYCIFFIFEMFELRRAFRHDQNIVFRALWRQAELPREPRAGLGVHVGARGPEVVAAVGVHAARGVTAARGGGPGGPARVLRRGGGVEKFTSADLLIWR